MPADRATPEEWPLPVLCQLRRLEIRVHVLLRQMVRRHHVVSTVLLVEPEEGLPSLRVIVCNPHRHRRGYPREAEHQDADQRPVAQAGKRRQVDPVQEPPHLLEIARQHGANWKAFEVDVRDRYFARNNASDYNKGKLANNTKLSLRAYGLISEKDATLTEIGQVLYDLRHEKAALYEAFGRHILKHCQGMNFVQCLLDMQVAGEYIDLNKLRRGLEERGISVPRGERHMSTLRLWLEKAGVFVSRYRVDHARLNKILGLNVEEFEKLATFSPEQRAYLKTLTNIDGGGPHFSNDIERLAATTYGVNFNEKNLPKQVLYPLRKAGYIELERGTKTVGRGAKPFLVTATGKLVADIIVPLIEQLEQQTQQGFAIRQPGAA